MLKEVVKPLDNNNIKIAQEFLANKINLDLTIDYNDLMAEIDMEERAKLGAALIGLSFISFGGAPGLGAAFKGGFSAANFANVGFISKGLAGLGAALVLQGVSEMLFPLPKPPSFESEEDPRLSFSFGGTQQTGRAGTPVPLVFGEIFTGSVVISGSVDTEQVQA